ncbi:MAG: aspartate-semialdehyde dehydrogenase [Acidobacteriota bacterium]|nr:aspartate-semialdehyde dehydrogenase [Acidobacteriota bacterium]
MPLKTPVGILGATGVVGQRFIQLLEQHPWFEVAWLAASDRSEGKTYEDATRWRLKTPMPTQVAGMRVSPAIPDGAPKIILAALDASIAAEMEPRFARAGCAVVSNSSALRMQPDVPLVIPEVNAEHLELIECQKWRRDSGGYVVTNPNCSAIGLVIALAPLHEHFGIDAVSVVTMQAVSGAGYPGVASLDILGNVIPYIAKEEEKMEEETRKLLGCVNSSRIIPAEFAMSAQCNRVAVEDGHTESVSVRLKKKANFDDIIQVWRQFRGVTQDLALPTSLKSPIQYTTVSDRPQPRLDVDAGGGMTTTVGRLRPCGLLDWKFTALSHNTIRGAAGAAVLNAELLKVKGYL